MKHIAFFLHLLSCPVQMPPLTPLASPYVSVIKRRLPVSPEGKPINVLLPVLAILLFSTLTASSGSPGCLH